MLVMKNLLTVVDQWQYTGTDVVEFCNGVFQTWTQAVKVCSWPLQYTWSIILALAQARHDDGTLGEKNPKIKAFLKMASFTLNSRLVCMLAMRVFHTGEDRHQTNGIGCGMSCNTLLSRNVNVWK